MAGLAAVGIVPGAGVVKGVGLLGRIASPGRHLLPDALSVGYNARPGVDVYLGIRAGEPVYVGITNDLARRFAEHSSFEDLRQVTLGQVTCGQARAIEQALIIRHPGFENKINSISPTHSWYQQAVNWGEQWLRDMGL